MNHSLSPVEGVQTIETNKVDENQKRMLEFIMPGVQYIDMLLLIHYGGITIHSKQQ